MKPVKLVLVAMLSIMITTKAFPQGASCTNPHVMTLDSVIRNYPVSPTSGGAAHCGGSNFNGSGKITVFRFTTDATGSCVLIHVSTASPVQPVELALYTGCGGTGNCSGLQTTSSVCFDDGEGYWAPSETYTLTPNTTYYLRAWTPAAGTLDMSATNYPPPNNLCTGAKYISSVETNDQNACNKASTEVAPIDLCAFSLENTGFYTYYVESNGVSSIQLNSINCDNSSLGADNGFQIGFFVGTCGSLNKISCATGSGGSLTGTTPWLPAGTQVFVALDGTSGSNCSYKITAFNAILLPVTLKYFTVWKRPDANRVTWMTTSEKSFSHFEIEKSLDGMNFINIGTKQGQGGPDREASYSFDDYQMKAVQYYRLKYVNADKTITYSNIVKMNRDDAANTKVIFSNMVSSQLSLRIIDMPTEELSMKIIDNAGREIKSQKVRINTGENRVNMNTGSIPNGFYYLLLTGENYKRTFSFVKS